MAPWNETSSQRVITTFCSSAANTDPQMWCWVGTTSTNAYAPGDTFCNAVRSTGVLMRLDCSMQRTYVCRKPENAPPTQVDSPPAPDTTGTGFQICQTHTHTHTQEGRWTHHQHQTLQVSRVLGMCEVHIYTHTHTHGQIQRQVSVSNSRRMDEAQTAMAYGSFQVCRPSV